MRIWTVVVLRLAGFVCWPPLMEGAAVGGQPPVVVQHVKVYGEAGRFAGWPANHGIWSWGNEILVGFSRGFSKDNGSDYHIDRDKAEDFLIARSRDGGISWSVEEPKPQGALVGTRGMRHAAMPKGLADEQTTELPDRIHFNHPDFAMIVRMESHQEGASRVSISYDRGKPARAVPAPPLRTQRHHGSNRLHRQRPRGLFALPHGDEIRRHGRPPDRGSNGRRRQDLELPRVHWAGAAWICSHAVVGSDFGHRSRDDTPHA